MRKIMLSLLAVLACSGRARASDIVSSTLRAPNPGALQMFHYVPESLTPGAALVVVLHGCSQDADSYVELSGWQTLADTHGFALLAPQQSESNNPGTCFNWFENADNARDQGEALSIHNMAAQLLADFDLDRERVFVTGLSAGGYMTTAMLASYPEVFAAGAVVAGGPYGCADSANTAFSCMSGSVTKAGADWAELVTSKTDHQGDYPRLSVWHGQADGIVSASNADELVKQWTALHGLAVSGADEDELTGHRRLRYGSPPVVELILIAGMGHAVAVDPQVCGAAGPYASDVGVCSSLEIARFWGLVGPDDGPGGGPGGGDDGDAGAGKSDGSGGCSLTTHSPGNLAVLMLVLGGFLFFVFVLGRRRSGPRSRS